MRLRLVAPGLPACVLASACSVTPDSDVPTSTTASTTITTAPATEETGPDDTTSTGTGSTAGSADSTTGEKLDVGGNDSGTASGCSAIDILFVIDNSASMNTYQEALSEAFPSFIDALWESLPEGTSVHVGVTTTDFGSPQCSGASESTSNCQSTASATEITEHYDTPVNAPTEVNGSQGRLFSWDDRYFFEASTDDANDELKTWFAGAATAAGENGCTFEMPVASAGWAFTAPNVGDVLSTNDDFLRNEGTVLVLFFLTDEPDKSPESVAVHRDRVLAAKAGCGGNMPDDTCVVTAGFIPDCTIGVNQKLWQFMTAFGEGEDDVRWGDITDIPAYDELVGTVLAGTISETCEMIPPVG